MSMASVAQGLGTVRVGGSGQGLEWTCGWTPCVRAARWATTFTGVAGHVHHCPECLEEAMKRFDIETVQPMPCPYTHGETYESHPPELEGSA